jgi:hypothetical protein
VIFHGFEEIMREKKKIKEDVKEIAPQYLDRKGDHLQ